MDLIGAFQKFPSGNYTVWSFIRSMYLNLGIKSDYDQSYRKYLLSSRSSSLNCALYNFWPGGFSENGFNSMISLGLSFLCVVGDYKIYTEFVPRDFFQNPYWFYYTLYIDLFLLVTSLLEGVIFLHYDSCQVYTIIGDASPLSNPVY